MIAIEYPHIEHWDREMIKRKRIKGVIATGYYYVAPDSVFVYGPYQTLEEAKEAKKLLTLGKEDMDD